MEDVHEKNKQMKPLTHGSILIAGTKISNLPKELREHPRLILWDSQDRRWALKELPVNTQAVFTTRWIGHNEFDHILKEVRKKNIVIFPMSGTGAIIKGVRELLDIKSEEDMRKRGKLDPLVQFIDPEKSHADNGRIMFEKAQELNIPTTLRSVIKLASKTRRQENSEIPLDISVQMLDEMIKSMNDMRDFLVATTKENQELKARIDNFKKMLDGEN